MENKRLQKVGRLIQREMGDMLRDAITFIGGGLITVTKVNVTPDLQIARVNVSIFGVPDKQAALEQLKTHTSELRFELGNRIRHQVRIIPELHFYLDDTLDYIEKIDNLLKQ